MAGLGEAGAEAAVGAVKGGDAVDVERMVAGWKRVEAGLEEGGVRRDHIGDDVGVRFGEGRTRGSVDGECEPLEEGRG
jgi:hypothetical protein